VEGYAKVKDYVTVRRYDVLSVF